MARKTIRVSDQSGREIPEGKGATVRITFGDARKGIRELDLTDQEADALGGRPVARRGSATRKSGEATAALNAAEPPAEASITVYRQREADRDLTSEQYLMTLDRHQVCKTAKPPRGGPCRKQSGRARHS